MILLSQISPDQYPIDEYEMHTARGSSPGSCGTARQKPGCVIGRHFRNWAVCCNVYKPSPQYLKTPKRCAPLEGQSKRDDEQVMQGLGLRCKADMR
jgi:hypothetical protein